MNQIDQADIALMDNKQPPGMTEGDLNMIDYFWFQKEDIERWSSWSSRKPFIEASHPEIAKAWDDYKTARRTLDAVIKGSAS